ncbi:hypothetical protein DI243_11905 [Paenibacillus polymyxa]|nr:hypothetical protein RE92_00080 [Paenibacillus polymyxa]QOH62068.1 hypothetical protein DI243_11905 [Paenibacillus polymyxa]
MLKTYLPQPQRDVLSGVKNFFQKIIRIPIITKFLHNFNDFKLEEDDPKLHLSLKGIIYYMETWR